MTEQEIRAHQEEMKRFYQAEFDPKQRQTWLQELIERKEKGRI